MSSVVGRAIPPAPGLSPTERKFFGGHSARRLITLSFAPHGETKDISFPFINAGENRTIRVRILETWGLENAAAGPGAEGEEFGTHWVFTWPEGVSGVNPRNPLAFVKKSGGVIGNRFGPPLNECLPTTKDGATLKIAYTKDSGTATATAVIVTLEVLEAWEVAEAPTLKPSLGAHAVGVARPKMKVVACNGGTATLPPIEEGIAS